MDSVQVGFGIGDTLWTCVTDMEIFDGNFIFNITMRVRDFVQAILVNFVRIILIFFNIVIAPMIGLDIK